MNEGYSFVKTGDLKDYMSGIGLDADQAEASQDVLDGLQRELERHCRRLFERKERTERVRVDELGRVWPRAVPVVSITSPVDTFTVGWGNMLDPVSSLTLAAPWGLPGGFVELTYVGGLDPEEDDLHDVRIAILRAAAREVTDRHDDTLSVKDTDARDRQRTDKRELGFTEAELKKFDRLRRRTVA